MAQGFFWTVIDRMTPDTSSVPGLTRNWDFTPSPVKAWQRRANAELFLRTLHRNPPWQQIKPLTPRPEWTVYFLFLPDGQLSVSHRFTLSRLRDLGLPILAICATPGPGNVPQELHGLCDALVWKGVDGYDFSAYKLALWQISRRSPGADVFVLNDSLFGPFFDVRELLRSAPWDLTGFMGSNAITNHLQSYAFALRNVTPARMARLAAVFFPFMSVSDRDAVIHLQELRMARVAARAMKVGSLWFADADTIGNPTIKRPLEIIEAGFPFLKRMLLTKPLSFTKCPASKEALLDRLRQLGHPVDADMYALAID